MKKEVNNIKEDELWQQQFFSPSCFIIKSHQRAELILWLSVTSESNLHFSPTSTSSRVSVPSLSQSEISNHLSVKLSLHVCSLVTGGSSGSSQSGASISVHVVSVVALRAADLLQRKLWRTGNRKPKTWVRLYSTYTFSRNYFGKRWDCISS